MLADCCGASNEEWGGWCGWWCTGGRLAREADEHAGLFGVVHGECRFPPPQGFDGLGLKTVATPGGDACGADNGAMLELECS